MVLNDKELRFFSTVRYEQIPLFPKAKIPPGGVLMANIFWLRQRSEGKLLFGKISE